MNLCFPELTLELTLCLWHEEGTERQAGGGGDWAVQRERVADTGRGNRCNSEPGDMTYGQTVRTLMGLNRRASEKERFIFR